MSEELADAIIDEWDLQAGSGASAGATRATGTKQSSGSRSASRGDEPSTDPVTVRNSGPNSRQVLSFVRSRGEISTSSRRCWSTRGSGRRSVANGHQGLGMYPQKTSPLTKEVYWPDGRERRPCYHDVIELIPETMRATQRTQQPGHGIC
jgi:hypothetical protein